MWCEERLKKWDWFQLTLVSGMDEKRNTDKTKLAETYLYRVGFWMYVRTGLISAQMISEKGYPALVFRLLILLLLPLTTEIATTVLSMAGYHQGLHRRSKQNHHQPMIPYFPYSYSPINVRYRTLSNCWNITQSLVDKPCGVQPWSVWYHKTWMFCWYYQHPVSSPLFIIIDNTKFTLNMIKD